MIESLLWHGHASFSLHHSPRIMIDPWSVPSTDPKPDIILVSHEHYDHCSPADVNKLRHSETIVIASKGAAQLLDGEVKVLRPWQVMNVGRVSIRAVPAYTLNGDHPMDREDLGFVISADYTDLYYAGDTDFVPELRNLRCDIAILPAQATEGVMDLNAASAFAEHIRPRYIVPSHLGHQVSSATKLELQRFERGLSAYSTVVTLPLGQPSELFAHR
jgi:L-ascorbate metabolism protein UlaG (beta-lactamase superfamily)